MARCLIIGCGCRGQLLARELRARGHAVRGTSRDPRRVDEIARAGHEGFLADPDRLATFSGAFDHVTIACVLLGSAAGDAESIAALHGPRLQTLLSRMLDTTVHGIVYEARGSVDAEVRRGGTALVRDACERSRIPFALLEADPADYEAWGLAALDGVARVLG